MPFAPPGTRFAPGGVFLLGTDHLGRDILSRILYGARTVLLYVPLATGCAYAVGISMWLIVCRGPQGLACRERRAENVGDPVGSCAQGGVPNDTEGRGWSMGSRSTS